MEIQYYYYFAAIYNYLSCIGVFVRRGIYPATRLGTRTGDLYNHCHQSISERNMHFMQLSYLYLRYSIIRYCRLNFIHKTEQVKLTISVYMNV